jgi:hypothetical protein
MSVTVDRNRTASPSVEQPTARCTSIWIASPAEWRGGALRLERCISFQAAIARQFMELSKVPHSSVRRKTWTPQKHLLFANAHLRLWMASPCRLIARQRFDGMPVG